MFIHKGVIHKVLEGPKGKEVPKLEEKSHL